MTPTLPGLMTDFPLTLTHLLERGRTCFPRREVKSRLPDGTIAGYTYADFHRRTRRTRHGDHLAPKKSGEDLR